VIEDDHMGKNKTAELPSISSTIPQNTAKQYHQSVKPKILAIHRYPTRIKTARAANNIQMEQSLINNPEPVTYAFIQDIIKSPDQLKNQDLIKGNTCEV